MNVRGRPLLYHLGDDPGEREDLVAREPKLAAQLQEAYAQWEREMEHSEPR